MKFKFHRIIIKEIRRIMGLGQLEKKVNKTSFEWGKTKQNKETKKKKNWCGSTCWSSQLQWEV
jgi:hypothetical protein